MHKILFQVSIKLPTGTPGTRSTHLTTAKPWNSDYPEVSYTGIMPSINCSPNQGCPLQEFEFFSRSPHPTMW